MSVDTGMRQSLVEAGLIDPSSGSFLSEPNFGAAPEGDTPRDPLPDLPEDGGRDEPKPSEQPQQRQDQPQPRTEQVEAGTPPPAGTPEHSPDRLGAESDPVRQRYEATVSALDRDAEMAFHYGRSLTDEEGKRLYTDDQLQTFIGQQLAVAKHQTYLAGVMERMQPVAKRAAAEKYAKDYGVEVDDIINEPNPVAMETRAKTIADLVRDGRFQKRKGRGQGYGRGFALVQQRHPRGDRQALPAAEDLCRSGARRSVGCTDDSPCCTI
jgi:hypothetical protein